MAAAPPTPAAATPVLPGSGDALANFLHIAAPITVEAPIVSLTVRDLFRLENGSIVATSQPAGANIPVHVATTLVAWAEFQVFDEKLAVRLAELV